jgi:hypothetical protein
MEIDALKIVSEENDFLPFNSSETYILFLEAVPEGRATAREGRKDAHVRSLFGRTSIEWVI